MKVLGDLAEITFRRGVVLIKLTDFRSTQGQHSRVIAFEKPSGKERRVRKAANSDNSYPSDWMLALVDGSEALPAFTPFEIQTMDTTGGYQRQWSELNRSQLPENVRPTEPGFNCENVNKRIIAQLLIKGNVFAREGLL